MLCNEDRTLTKCDRIKDSYNLKDFNPLYALFAIFIWLLVSQHIGIV